MAGTKLLIRFPRMPKSWSKPFDEPPAGHHRLRRFYFRSILTFFGPLLALAFYINICFSFLNKDCPYGIVPSTPISARWSYYIWFIIVVFMLDWARAGLANIEAAALMHRSLAPKSAMELMWHTDSKWANPLWWLRAAHIFVWNLLWRVPIIRSSLQLFRKHILRRSQACVDQGYDLANAPGPLWIGLSMTSLLLFVGLPLSGLTMEISNVQVFSDQLAILRGPNATTFNKRMSISPMNDIKSLWQTGRQTNPGEGSILYPPEGTENVSTVYYDDKILERAPHIEFFTGPATNDIVHGKVWGMHSNLSCMPVSKDKFTMLKVDRFDYSVRRLSKNINSGNLTEWVPASAGLAISDGFCTYDCWPFAYHMSNTKNTQNPWWLTVVADGYEQRFAGNKSPYTVDSNHDNMTFDSQINKRSKNEPTTAMLEMFLWQSLTFDGLDPDLNEMMAGGYPDPIALTQNLGGNETSPKNLTYVGIGVHCDIRTRVGWAEIDASTRTFSKFRPQRAESSTLDNNSTYDMWPPQIFAIEMLNKYAQSGLTQDGLTLLDTSNPYSVTDEVFDAFHTATNKHPLPDPVPGVALHAPWPALTPKDLQLAAYRLLGQSIIVMMCQGGVYEWTGSLMTVKPGVFITRGLLSWQIVLVFLTAWTFINCLGALWMLFLAGPRWATSLDGFQMFKFGAQHTDDVHTFKSVEFQGCGEALRKIPGSVGMLSGYKQETLSSNASNESVEKKGAIAKTVVPTKNQSKLRFIGLSGMPAEEDADYTLDRYQAEIV